MRVQGLLFLVLLIITGVRAFGHVDVHSAFVRMAVVENPSNSFIALDDTSEVPYSGPMQFSGPVISANGPLTFCPGGSVILTVNGATPGSQFLWNTGQTTKSISVSNPGIYSAKVTMKKGQCVKFTPPVTVTISSLVTDFDNSGVVDVPDYMLLLGVFNSTCTSCLPDLFPDSFIDTRDYLLWVRDIYKTCN
jgi:putative transposon-encoded protein